MLKYSEIFFALILLCIDRKTSKKKKYFYVLLVTYHIMLSCPEISTDHSHYSPKVDKVNKTIALNFFIISMQNNNNINNNSNNHTSATASTAAYLPAYNNASTKFNVNDPVVILYYAQVLVQIRKHHCNGIKAFDVDAKNKLLYQIASIVQL